MMGLTLYNKQRKKKRKRERRMNRNVSNGANMFIDCSSRLKSEK
jgi:hypothetical protein